MGNVGDPLRGSPLQQQCSILVMLALIVGRGQFQGVYSTVLDVVICGPV